MTIHLRTWGSLACFTRPEMKAERGSHPIMTPAAWCATENHVIPAFLERVFDQPQNARNGSLN